MALAACTNCQQKIERPPSHLRHKQVFCSRSCRKSFSVRPVVCRGCSKPYPRVPGQPRRQYCTWDCFKASRHTTVTCQVCDVQFDSYISEHHRRIRRAHIPCCSRHRRNVYTSLLFGGDGTWQPGGHSLKRQRGPHWRRVRAEYLRMVGGTCEGCCGAPATQVHHLHPIAMGGDLLSFDNLMAVCTECHENMHYQLRVGAFACSFESVATDA